MGLRSVFPLRGTEKVYLAVLGLHGFSVTAIYWQTGATFGTGFAVGVWVSLFLMLLFFSTFFRLLNEPDPFEELYRGGHL